MLVIMLVKARNARAQVIMFKINRVSHSYSSSPITFQQFRVIKPRFGTCCQGNVKYLLK